MAAGDFESEGAFTLTVTAPGVLVAQTVTDAAVSATSNIVLTPTNDPSDAQGPFHFYVTAGAGSFVVTSDRGQLQTAATFNYQSFEGA